MSNEVKSESEQILGALRTLEEMIVKHHPESRIKKRISLLNTMLEADIVDLRQKYDRHLLSGVLHRLGDMCDPVNEIK